jgi:hypothetical protein
VGHVTRMGKNRNAHRVLVGKRGREIPLVRRSRRWEDNIKMGRRVSRMGRRGLGLPGLG